LYVTGLPGALSLPAFSINSYSNNLYIAPSELTPLISSICALVILGLYAIIANVSNAALDKLGLFLLSIIGYIYW